MGALVHGVAAELGVGMNKQKGTKVAGTAGNHKV